MTRRCSSRLTLRIKPDTRSLSSVASYDAASIIYPTLNTGTMSISRRGRLDLDLAATPVRTPSIPPSYPLIIP